MDLEVGGVALEETCASVLFKEGLEGVSVDVEVVHALSIEIFLIVGMCELIM